MTKPLSKNSNNKPNSISDEEIQKRILEGLKPLEETEEKFKDGEGVIFLPDFEDSHAFIPPSKS